MTGEGNPAVLMSLLHVAIAVVAVAGVATPAGTRDVLEHLRMGYRVTIRLADLPAGSSGKGGKLARGNRFEAVP